MADSVNVVVLTGILERDPTMRFEAERGTAHCSSTLRCDELGATGGTFRLYVPLEAYGKAAEALGELHAGDLVGIQGKLCWRKSTTHTGTEKSGLAVLVSKCSGLVSAGVAVGNVVS